MDKKKFELPEIEVINFDEKDVITASGITTNGTYDDTDLGNHFDLGV